MNDSPKEIKEFKKKLRENSKKYHKDVLKTALWQCEICGWGSSLVQCMQIHHICPVETYAGIFFSFKDALSPYEFKNGMPDSRFERANQVVLCPNCHALVHLFIRESFQENDCYLFKFKGLTEYIFQAFVEYACQGFYDSKKINKFKDIVSGHLLGQRLNLRHYNIGGI